MSRQYDFYVWKRDQLGVAVANRRISRDAYALAMRLDELDHGKGVWASQETLAKLLGCGSRSVKRYLDELTDCGLIEREERSGATSLYRLGLPLTPLSGVGDQAEEPQATEPEASKGVPLTPLSGEVGQGCPGTPDTTVSQTPVKSTRKGVPVKDASLREGAAERTPTNPSQAAIYDVWWGEDGYLAEMVNAQERDVQYDVANLFESVLYSQATRPLGLLNRLRRDAHKSSVPTPVALRTGLRALVEEYKGPDCSWSSCVKCDENETPTPRSACRCPGKVSDLELVEASDVWPEVEGLFAGVPADVLDKLAAAVAAVLQSDVAEPAAVVRYRLPPQKVRDNITRDGRAEEAARRLTTRLWSDLADGGDAVLERMRAERPDEFSSRRRDDEQERRGHA